MTSDRDKTLAFLARRVGALEKKVHELEKRVEQDTNTIIENQQAFRPVVELLAELVPLVKEELILGAKERKQCIDLIRDHDTKFMPLLPACFEEGHGI